MDKKSSKRQLTEKELEDDYARWCHLILGHDGKFEDCSECNKKEAS